MIESWGFRHGQTQYSFSHSPDLLGAPSGFVLPVREVRLNREQDRCRCLRIHDDHASLPKTPGAAGMDIDSEGRLFGVFG